MIEDLKHRQNAFQLISEETAGALIGAALAVCLILDRLGVWAS